jgi:hypothetical protein
MDTRFCLDIRKVNQATQMDKLEQPKRCCWMLLASTPFRAAQVLLLDAASQHASSSSPSAAAGCH